MSRTAEESYVHAVNTAVAKGEDISEVYDHELYVACSHKNSIHGEVEEPLIMDIGLVIGFAIIIGNAIIRFGGI